MTHTRLHTLAWQATSEQTTAMSSVGGTHIATENNTNMLTINLINDNTNKQAKH